MNRLLLILMLLVVLPVTQAQTAHGSAPTSIAAGTLRDEVTNFLTTEMAAHLNDIKSYEPAPDKVFAAGTTGEYTWGTFMNAVGAYAALAGRRNLAGRDLAREVAQIGLLEYRLGGTRLSHQCYLLSIPLRG